MSVKYFSNVKFLPYSLFLKWYDLTTAYLKCDICDKLKMYLMSGFKKNIFAVLRHICKTLMVNIDKYIYCFNWF